MTDLSPKERALIGLTEGGDDPSEAARDRMRSNLFAQLGIGVAAAGATTAASATAKAATATAVTGTAAGAAATSTAATTAAGASLAPGAAAGAMASATAKGTLGAAATGAATTKAAAIKLALGAAIVTGLGGAGYVVTTEETGSAEAPATSHIAEPTVALVEQATTEASRSAARNDSTDEGESADAPTSAEPPEEPLAVAASPAGPRPRASNGPAIGGELGMLQKAQQELQSGDAKEALEVLDAHERRFGKGNLGEERMAVRVFALCEAGRIGEARAAAARFLSTHPQSPLASRVARACVAGKP